jgi:peptide/nickel transport system permease protein
MAETQQLPPVLAGPRRDGWFNSKTMRRFRRNPLALVGALLLLAFFLMAVFAPQLTASRLTRGCQRALGVNSETVMQIRNPLNGVFWKAIFAPPLQCMLLPRAGFSPVPTKPSAAFPLGTTSNGYDILYGVVWGSRTAFYEGGFVVAVALLIGTLFGSLAGYFGGWIDNALMRFTDIIFAFPSLILVMVIVTFLGRDLINIMIAIAAVQWANYARVLRGDIMKIKEMEFIDGAEAIGARHTRVILKHLIPNAIGPLVIIASLDIGSVVLTAAALSFLGLGVQAGFADWGQMISYARDWILGPPGSPLGYWFVSFWPGLTIILFVLGWNLLGDAFRDVLDPRGTG